MTTSKCPSSEMLCAHKQGSLPELLREDLDEHLQHCERCRILLRQYRKMPDVVATVTVTRPDIEVPAGVESADMPTETLPPNPTTDPNVSSSDLSFSFRRKGRTKLAAWAIIAFSG